MTSKAHHTENPAEALAEKIASILKGGDADQRVLAALEDLTRRIEKLESVPEGFASNSANVHPSLAKYSLNEAAADASGEAKLCTFEPHGRPCDHCSMCSARGF